MDNCFGFAKLVLSGEQPLTSRAPPRTITPSRVFLATVKSSPNIIQSYRHLKSGPFAGGGHTAAPKRSGTGSFGRCGKLIERPYSFKLGY